MLREKLGKEVESDRRRIFKEVFFEDIICELRLRG